MRCCNVGARDGHGGESGRIGSSRVELAGDGGHQREQDRPKTAAECATLCAGLFIADAEEDAISLAQF